MTPQTQYEISSFLADKAFKELMDNLRKLNKLCDRMLMDAEYNRDVLRSIVMEESKDDTSSCIECGGERFDTGTPGRCKDC